MRQIIFKGKRADNGEWVYGDFIKPNAIYVENEPSGKLGNASNGRFSIGLDVFLVISESVGQFTGLTDKNEVKIFEGDILKCISPNDGFEFVTDFISTLGNGITFKNQSLRRDMIIYEYDWMEIEIVGNIHDNPEILYEKS